VTIEKDQFDAPTLTLPTVNPPKLTPPEGKRPEDPGEFTRPQPKKPVKAQTLDEIKPLAFILDNKYIIEIVTPDPEPVTPIVYPVVVINGDGAVGGDGVFIPDEEVPLADAPKTGDLTGIWAALSALSLGGFGLLSRKRKEEE